MENAPVVFIGMLLLYFFIRLLIYAYFNARTEFIINLMRRVKENQTDGKK